MKWELSHDGYKDERGWSLWGISRGGDLVISNPVTFAEAVDKVRGLSEDGTDELVQTNWGHEFWRGTVGEFLAENH